jgi:hypothetical protein
VVICIGLEIRVTIINSEMNKSTKADMMLSCETTTRSNKKPSVHDRMKVSSYRWSSLLEDMMDEYLDSGEQPSIYNWLIKNDISGPVANYIAEKFQLIHEEVTHAIKKTDKDCVEAYCIYETPVLKNMQSFAHNVVSDCTKHHTNSIATRKPRKKKVKKAEDQIKGLQYLQQDTKYKVVSVDPANIVGADQLWTFNVKTRDLTVFRALGRAGLSIKGTTLYGWDQENSETRKLRKPEQVIERVLSGGKIVLKKVMGELTTKPSKTTGRINNDTILLRVVK